MKTESEIKEEVKRLLRVREECEDYGIDTSHIVMKIAGLNWVLEEY